MKRLSVILILLAGVTWGTSCLFVDKVTSLGFTSMQCTAIRTVFAALILNAIAIIKGRGFSLYKLSFRSYLISAITGICSVLATSAFYYLSMTMTSAAVSVILLYTAPIFVMIMSLALFGERLSIKKSVAFVFAIVGCALASGIASGATVSTLGIIFGVLSGFSYSLYGILTSLFMKNNSNPWSFTATSFIFAALGAIAICDPVDAVKNVATQNSVPLLILLFVAFGLCTSAIPFVFYTLGLSGVSPSVASILAFSEPLAATVFGVALLGQKIDVFGVLGLLSVTLAIVILNVGTPKKHAKNTNNTESY